MALDPDSLSLLKKKKSSEIFIIKWPSEFIMILTEDSHWNKHLMEDQNSCSFYHLFFSYPYSDQ